MSSFKSGEVFFGFECRKKGSVNTLISSHEGTLSLLEIPTMRGTHGCGGFLEAGGSSPVLNHTHGHPVSRVHIFPNEVLEHDEGLHQEVLEQ